MHSAEEEGIEKGIKKGMKAGIKEGEKRGKEIGERLKTEEVAIKMLEEGIDEKTILKVTNLSIEEIEKIKKEIKYKVKK